MIESNRPPKLTPETSIWGAGDECSPVRLSLIKETIDEYKDIVPDDQFDHILAKRQPKPLEGKLTRRWKYREGVFGPAQRCLEGKLSGR